MDFLDEVDDLEGLAYRQGYEMGVWDAKNGDMYDAGVQSGIIKGYPIGLELGFMQSLQEDATDLVKKEEDEKEKEQTIETDYEDVVEETIESMSNGMEFNGRPKDAIRSIGSRIEKRRKLLAKRISEVPSYNASDVDFDAEMESLRALYRSCNPSAGNFLREGSIAKEDTQTW